MRKSNIIATVFVSFLLSFSLPSHSALISVLDGQGVYDDVNNLTWYTSVFSGNFSSVNSQVSNLVVDDITEWRLPDHNAQEYNLLRDQIGIAGSELALTFFGNSLINNVYFTGTSTGQSFPSTDIWAFYWNRDLSAEQYTSNQLAGLAVISGDVSAVPIPAAAFMFAPALLGFMGFRRRAKNSVA